MSQIYKPSSGSGPSPGSTCHFQAYLNAPQIINAGDFTTIIFNATTTNVGGAYDIATGIFTAPETGFYSFDSVMWNEMQTSGAQTELLLKYLGSAQSNRIFQNGVGAWSSGTVMIIASAWSMPMTAGDTIQIQSFATGTGTFTEIGQAIGMDGRCTFSGFLVGF